MHYDSYKDWIDAMPVDDVRARIERLERKLSDLRMLERLYGDRHGEATPSEPEQQAAAGGEGAPYEYHEPGGEHG